MGGYGRGQPHREEVMPQESQDHHQDRRERQLEDRGNGGPGGSIHRSRPGPPERGPPEDGDNAQQSALDVLGLADRQRTQRVGAQREAHEQRQQDDAGQVFEPP